MVKRLSLFIFGCLLVAALLVQIKLKPVEVASAAKEQILAKHEMSLEDRYPNAFVNNVFKENILLTLSYLSGQVRKPEDIDWKKINQSFHYDLTLMPGQVFAFHDAVLPQYKNASLVTTHAHFDSSEGFISDGDLYGDGVCHLASLLNWVAKDAGLSVTAPTNHNFAHIPDIPMQYGTAIYTSPNAYEASAQQNLYIQNTLDKPVHFVFDYINGKVEVTVSKEL
jgi:hypothetical protein